MVRVVRTGGVWLCLESEELAIGVQKPVVSVLKPAVYVLKFMIGVLNPLLGVLQPVIGGAVQDFEFRFLILITKLILSQRIPYEENRGENCRYLTSKYN